MDEPIDNGSDGAIHNPHQERLPAPVYYISSPDDKSVMVGIDVRLLIYEPGRAKILWDDPFIRTTQESGGLRQLVKTMRLSSSGKPKATTPTVSSQ